MSPRTRPAQGTVALPILGLLLHRQGRPSPTRSPFPGPLQEGGADPCAHLRASPGLRPRSRHMLPRLCDPRPRGAFLAERASVLPSGVAGLGATGLLSGPSAPRVQVILCFSPVGSVLRVRARKFPAVVNCTAIDWFHEWPEDALVSVSARFLEETEGIQVRRWGPAPSATLRHPLR